MNRKGQQKAMEIEERLRNAPKDELLKRLIQRRNMGLLCHCSAEIDQSTLLYFSVNNMFLGTGEYILIMFAETSSNTKEQEEGMDVFSRSYTYTIIQEEVDRLMGGHFTIYPCELDGRLVILVLFHYGISDAQREGLLGMIGDHCQDVAAICANEYDMHVTAYISEVFNEIKLTASIYHKMLSAVTLHQYMHTFKNEPFFLIGHPASDAPGPMQLDEDALANKLANEIISGDNSMQMLEEILETIRCAPFLSTDELRITYGDFFEKLVIHLRLRGLRFNADSFRSELIASVQEATHFEDLVVWMRHFVEHMTTISHTKSQTVASNRYYDALSYIDLHLDNPALSVTDIADGLGLTPPTLITLFRKNLGVTPAKYIRDKRLSQAAELLKSESCSVQEVCDKCGFGSLETFHRVFKNKYGLPPGQFRIMSKQ